MSRELQVILQAASPSSHDIIMQRLPCSQGCRVLGRR